MSSRWLVFASLLVVSAGCGSKGLRSASRYDGGVDGGAQVRDTISASLDEDASPDLGRDGSLDLRSQGPEGGSPEVGGPEVGGPEVGPDAALDRRPDSRLAFEVGASEARIPDSRIMDGGPDRSLLGPDAADASDALLDRPVLGDVDLGDALLGDSALAADSPSPLELVAGVLGGLGTADGIGAAARFFMPNGIVYDDQGRLFVADEGNHVVRQVVVATGVVSTLAGVAQRFGFADGVGEGARFQSPTGITSDGQGNLFVIDSGNHVIRKIVVATGAVSTVPEMVEQGGVRTIVGNLAFSSPSALVHDRQGALYVAEVGVIRKLVLDTGVLTVVAGSGMSGDRDGVGSAAEVSHPGGLALDGAGNLVVADTQNASIRKIDLATRQVTTIDRTRFTWPQTLASDGQGALYVVDAVDSTLRRLVMATGEVTLIAGAAGKAGPDDGTGASARFSGPSGIALDGAGNAFIADEMNHVVRKVVLGTGVVTTLAGSATQRGSVDGPKDKARFEFQGSTGVSVGLVSDGEHLFFADSGNHAIRAITPDTGEVGTLAGAPGECKLTDGTGKAARFCSPEGIAYDGAGSLFVADTGNHVIRRIGLSTALVTTIAGTPGTPGSADGVGAAASFNGPQGIAADDQGNVYVADADNHTVRRIVVSSGAVTTLAGSPGLESSDDGVGGLAHFRRPTGLAWDGVGSLLVADSDNRTIRRINLASRTVTTLAGKAGTYGSQDGIGTQALFYRVSGLASDGAGNLFVADIANQSIRKVVLDTGAVSTIVGSPDRPGVMLGPLPASLGYPTAVAFVRPGLLFIADSGESVILRARF